MRVLVINGNFVHQKTAETSKLNRSYLAHQQLCFKKTCAEQLLKGFIGVKKKKKSKLKQGGGEAETIYID